MSEHPPIYVTRPDLPPLKEFLPYLEQIWENRILTNGGPFHQQLEQALREYLGVEHIALFSNATTALITALQALRVHGEVITTPYSFVATSHALLWNGIEPVFADIELDTFNLDPAKVEAAITPKTTAILPVHCYGRPCQVETLQKIADDYNLKIIYDAAHAFGVRDNGGSILRYGDLSVLSFHATKVFTTFEGGAIVCPDATTKTRIDRLKNFGFVDETTVASLGINGKMSEFNSALGMLQLQYVDRAVARRRAIDTLYRRLLNDVPGIVCLPPATTATSNYSYFPILVMPGSAVTRDELYHRLRKSNIYARRYFYPLISEFPMYRGLRSASRTNLPLATAASQRVLCLPIYPDLSDEQVLRITECVAGKELEAADWIPFPPDAAFGPLHVQEPPLHPGSF